MRMGTKQKGFTIVELLIVIVVIAILAAITVVAYNGIQNRAKAVKTQSNAREVANKMSAWQAILGSYPSYNQLSTNSLSPTWNGSAWVAGGGAGPAEAKLSGNYSIVYNVYPVTETQVAYIECTSGPGYYIVYPDSTAPNTVNAISVGGSSGIVYGSAPGC